MYYYVRNRSGNEFQVTEEIYEDRLSNDEYECWKEDPYSTENLPETVEQISYPNHTGGGWYELSNGDKVRGKDNAIEAQNNLE